VDRDPSDGMFGCFSVSGLKYNHISRLRLAKRTTFLSSTYYYTNLERVSDTGMEPQKDKKAAGINWGDITTSMTELRVRASHLAPMTPQEETNTHSLCRRG
jgi:hypothetical protein